jgi:hypothetical protein
MVNPVALARGIGQFLEGFQGHRFRIGLRFVGANPLGLFVGEIEKELREAAQYDDSCPYGDLPIRALMLLRGNCLLFGRLGPSAAGKSRLWACRQAKANDNQADDILHG